MSRKRARTPLRGYGDPIFPRGIESLNNSFNCLEINSRKEPNLTILRNIGKVCLAFIKLRKNVKTKDGYIWPAGLYLKHRGEKMIIVFPFLEDKAAKGGVYLDRSIAVYLQGPMSLKTAETYVKVFSQEIKRIMRIFQARTT